MRSPKNKVSAQTLSVVLQDMSDAFRELSRMEDFVDDEELRVPIAVRARSVKSKLHRARQVLNSLWDEAGIEVRSL
ncbi:hypothetical protein CMI37_04520 [Candidatus Pacearchaeota archaeon]|nr:hypothetical protein [Candidatus Pacearchaeota archaeon]